MRLPRPRPTWYLELPLLVAGYFAFGLARAAIDRGDPTATSNALLVQHLEQTLRIAVEHPLNHSLLAHPIPIYLTGYFYRLCLIAIPATLIWLYLSHPAHYRHLRTILIITTLLDLPLVFLFPESPPRLAQPDIVDHMATHDILHSAASRTPQPGVNRLAAMPSMHIAWTTWSAYATWSALRPHHPHTPLLRWLPWLLPTLTAFTILATGHHYLLDIPAALALVTIATHLTNRIPNNQPDPPQPQSPQPARTERPKP